MKFLQGNQNQNEAEHIERKDERATPQQKGREESEAPILQIEKNDEEEASASENNCKKKEQQGFRKRNSSSRGVCKQRARIKRACKKIRDEPKKGHTHIHTKTHKI